MFICICWFLCYIFPETLSKKKLFSYLKFFNTAPFGKRLGVTAGQASLELNGWN